MTNTATRRRCAPIPRSACRVCSAPRAPAMCVIANALGSGVLETPAMLGFLPAICEALLGEPLAIAFGGDVVVRRSARAGARHCASTRARDQAGFPVDEAGADFRLHCSTRPDAKRWPSACARSPHAYRRAGMGAALAGARPGRAERAAFEPRVVGLRLYAVATANGYEVMPGGLARVSPAAGTDVISMQRGGSSKDTWVLDGAATPWDSLLQPRVTARDIVRGGTYSPSRAVENSFWMGRYAERVEVVGPLAPRDCASPGRERSGALDGDRKC